MSRKTSAYSRKRRQPDRDRCLDSITAARMNNTRLKPAELEKLLSPLRRALASARAGACSYDDLVNFSTAMHKGRAIEDTGVYRGLRTIIDGVEPVLDAIQARAQANGVWRAPTLYGPEILALDDLVWAYRVMLLEVTYAEFVRADRLAVARVATQGGQIIRQAEAA